MKLLPFHCAISFLSVFQPSSIVAVDSHLDQLRPAIKSYGGQVKVGPESGG